MCLGFEDIFATSTPLRRQKQYFLAVN